MNFENKPKKQKDSIQKEKRAFIIGLKMVSLTFSKVTLCPKVDSAGNANLFCTDKNNEGNYLN